MAKYLLVISMDLTPTPRCQPSVLRCRARARTNHTELKQLVSVRSTRLRMLAPALFCPALTPGKSAARQLQSGRRLAALTRSTRPPGARSTRLPEHAVYRLQAHAAPTHRATCRSEHGAVRADSAAAEPSRRSRRAALRSAAAFSDRATSVTLRHSEPRYRNRPWQQPILWRHKPLPQA